MRRVRLALGLALAFLTGWWAYAARHAFLGARELVEAYDEAVALSARVLTGTMPTSRPPRADGRLWPEEMCRDCPHRGWRHDPDLGCVGELAPGIACTCRRRRCPCPIDPPGASR